ncbi:hypothetical protein Tco_1077085, partial [Tanacetum coccineum]
MLRRPRYGSSTTREIHRVQVVDFQGMPELLRDGLFDRMAMEHLDEVGVVVFTSQAWRRMFSTRGPLVWEIILEFLSMLRFGEFILALGLHTGEEKESLGFARYWSESERMNPEKGGLHDYWRDISTDGDFLGPPPSYTLIRDPFLRLCHRMMAHGIAGRSQAPEKEVCRWEEERGAYFWWTVCWTIGLAFWITDCGDSERIDGPERQPDDAANAPVVAEDAPAIDEGRLEEDVQVLRKDVGILRGLVERSMTDQGRFSILMMTCMTQLMDVSGLAYQAFDGTFRGSSPLAFQRRT